MNEWITIHKHTVPRTNCFLLRMFYLFVTILRFVKYVFIKRIWMYNVCVCVCLSVSVCLHVSISWTTRAIFTKFLCMLPMAVARSSSGGVTKWSKSQGRCNFGGFLPHWQCSVQHSIWDPYKKRLNRSRCRLGWWLGWAIGTICYMGSRSHMGKGQFGWNLAARCKVMGHSTVRCIKTTEPIDMPFWMKTRVGRRNHVLDGVQILKEKGQFSGVVHAIQKHSQSSLQRRCRVRCERDHLIASNVMQHCRRDNSIWQASTNSILKISGRRRCDLSAAKGMVGLHSAGEVWYLRLPCWSCSHSCTELGISLISFVDIGKSLHFTDSANALMTVGVVILPAGLSGKLFGDHSIRRNCVYTYLLSKRTVLISENT